MILALDLFDFLLIFFLLIFFAKFSDKFGSVRPIPSVCPKRFPIRKTADQNRTAGVGFESKETTALPSGGTCPQTNCVSVKQAALINRDKRVYIGQGRAKRGGVVRASRTRTGIRMTVS